MTDEQINIAIAEHCGWNFNPTWAKEWDSADRWVESAAGERMFRHAIPDYCNDLNAMHEAEKTLGADIDAYADRCLEAAGILRIDTVLLTARDKAEAFLKAKGETT